MARGEPSTTFTLTLNAFVANPYRRTAPGRCRGEHLKLIGDRWLPQAHKSNLLRIRQLGQLEAGAWKGPQLNLCIKGCKGLCPGQPRTAAHGAEVGIDPVKRGNVSLSTVVRNASKPVWPSVRAQFWEVDDDGYNITQTVLLCHYKTRKKKTADPARGVAQQMPFADGGVYRPTDAGLLLSRQIVRASCLRCACCEHRMSDGVFHPANAKRTRAQCSSKCQSFRNPPTLHTLPAPWCHAGVESHVHDGPLANKAHPARGGGLRQQRSHWRHRFLRAGAVRSLGHATALYGHRHGVAAGADPVGSCHDQVNGGLHLFHAD